jgi:transposase-like protein
MVRKILMHKSTGHLPFFLRLASLVVLLGLTTPLQTFSQIVPGTPVPSSPANAATNQSIHLTFSWATTAHGVTYQLQVATASTFPDSSIVIDTLIPDNVSLTATCTVDSLKYNTKFYWRLNASSTDSTSPWSTVYNFTTVIAPPITPITTLPLSYARSVAVNSSLKWNAVASATTYQVQVDTSALFTSPVITDSTLTTTSKAVTSLLYFKQYYWHVRAKNVGGPSAWSSPQIFLTELAQPILSSPAATSANQPLSMVLKWNNNPAATLYGLQVSTSSTFANLFLVDSLISDTVRAIGPLNNNTTYYWRVNAMNDSCISRYQTTAFSFTTIVAAPANAPAPTAPTNAAVSQSVTPTIKWNAVTGATSYQVQVSTDTSYTTLVKDTTVTTLSVTLSALRNYTRYYWHVRAINVGGSSSFNSTQNFITELTQPTLTAPASNATNQTLPTTFSWSSVSSAMRYHLQVSTVSTFTSIAYQDSTLTDITDSVSSLLNSTTYYWRVKAKNDTCTSSWISIAPKFTTIIATPTMPLLSSPANNLVNDTIAPTLKWTASAGTTSYRVQVATDYLFTTPLVDDTSTTLAKVLSKLSYNTKYYWRVNAKNIGGISPYSTIWNFTTTLAAPTLSTPANRATNEPIDEVFSWSAVPGATSYHLVIGTDSLLRTISYDLPSLTSTTDTIHNIPNTMKYYWKVRGANANGEGVTSFVWSFTTLTLAPTAPTLTAPADTVGNQAVSILLQWSSLYNATTYQLQVSTDSSFATTMYDDTTFMVTQKQISGLSYNTRYFWRVRGKNSYGSGNYTARSFYTTLLTPTPSSPATGATNQPISISFVWDTIPGVTYYNLQLSTSSTFTTLSFIDSLVTATTRTVTSLANSTKYYWRVCARNSRGSGAFATVSSFTTVIPVPAAPKLSTPSNSAVNQALSVAFKWNTATSATSYRLQAATDSLFVFRLYDTTTTLLTTTLVMPLNAMTYYWRVFAINVGGSSPSSETWKLTTVTVAPTSPQLSSPKSGKVGIATTTTLAWNSVWSAKRYLVQVATDSPFDTVVNTTLSLDTTLQVSTLANGTLYYWRVKAYNDSGASDNSAVWNFTTRLQAPTLQFPYPSSEGISLSPTLKWSAVSKVRYYSLQLSTDSLCTQFVVNDSTLTALTYPVPGLQTYTKYYWRVGAKDMNGYTAYSDIATFTTLPPALQAPTLIAPISSANNLSLNPAFNWHSVTSATMYRFQISEDTPFKTLTYDDSTVTDTSIQKATLQYSKTYYWRVMSLNTTDKSLYSTIWSFSTASGIPATPIQTAPVNSATNLPRLSTFQWSAVATAATYHIQIAEDMSFTNIVYQDSTAVDTIVTGPQLDYGKQYYWRVRAANSAGKGLFSTVRTFTNANGQLLTPTLYAPANLATNVSATPILNWNKIVRATTYQIQIAEDVQFHAIAFQDTADLDTLSKGASLQNNKSYYWRVRAINSPDTSGFSNTWSFTTVIASPTIPILATPANDSYGVGLNTTLIWKKSSQAEIYDLQVTDDPLFRTFVYEDSTLTDTSCYVGPLRIYTRYYWRVKATNYASTSFFSTSWTFSTSPLTGVETIGSNIPKEVFLRQNYPNPFNPSTMIEFGLSEEAQVDIVVYNLLGKAVATLLADRLSAGYYRMPWNANHTASGIYFYRIVVHSVQHGNTQRTFTQTKKLVLLK